MTHSAETLDRLRVICLGLPDAYEEPAWTGTRWCIRKHNFAHVVRIVDGRPQSYAQAASTSGPATVLTFRSSGPELAALSNTGYPVFKPVWFADIVGMVIDDSTDWDEVAELVTESYCLLAPSRQVALVRALESTRGGSHRTAE